MSAGSRDLKRTLYVFFSFDLAEIFGNWPCSGFGLDVWLDTDSCLPCQMQIEIPQRSNRIDFDMGIRAASSASARGTRIRLQPFCRTLAAVGKMPHECRTLPSRDNSPITGASSRQLGGISPSTSKTPSAIGKSYLGSLCEPKFRALDYPGLSRSYISTASTSW